MNRRRTGEVEEFHNLVFHGGPDWRSKCASLRRAAWRRVYAQPVSEAFNSNPEKKYPLALSSLIRGAVRLLHDCPGERIGWQVAVTSPRISL